MQQDCYLFPQDTRFPLCVPCLSAARGWDSSESMFSEPQWANASCSQKTRLLESLKQSAMTVRFVRMNLVGDQAEAEAAPVVFKSSLVVSSDILSGWFHSSFFCWLYLSEPIHHLFKFSHVFFQRIFFSFSLTIDLTIIHWFFFPVSIMRIYERRKISRQK